MAELKQDLLVKGKLLTYFIMLIPKAIRAIGRLFDYALGRLVRSLIAYRTPVDNNKIILTTYNNKYMCNTKYICEKLLENNKDNKYKLVWLVAPNGKYLSSEYPKGVKLVRRYSYESYKELASAKVWIDNALNCVWRYFPKKEEQIYINTWHGSLGFKRIGPNDVADKKWVKRGKAAGKLVNYMISNSNFEDDVYRTSYFAKNEILQYGHPRNDIFFRNADSLSKIRQKVLDYYYLPTDVKVALYAPTFRDNGESSFPRVDFARLRLTLKERFGGEWVIFLRPHFKVKSGIPSGHTFENVKDYSDINELLVAADVGITDYSSWILDYLFTSKPGFLFTTDHDMYESERGFYYPLDQTPFTIAKNELELFENIRTFDKDKYDSDCQEFLRNKGCIEDGNACTRIVELINKSISS